MGHQALAEPVYRSVLLENPGNIDAMLGVAVALLAREEPAEAIELLELAEELAADNGAVLGALGRAHRLAGHANLAITYLERAVSIAPARQRLLSLEAARLPYLHSVETRGSAEEFSGASPDSRSVDLTLNLRLSDSWRLLARGQVQRKFASTEERGGGGVEWRWKPATTLRAQALVGADNRVMPERDYLGEVRHTYRAATWTASVRYFDFRVANTTVFSPTVAWTPDEGPFSLALGYAMSWTDRPGAPSQEAGHTAHVRGAYRVHSRLSILTGYATGVEDFENFSIDRIGDFRANTLSGGLRIYLPSMTAVVARIRVSAKTAQRGRQGGRPRDRLPPAELLGPRVLLTATVAGGPFGSGLVRNSGSSLIRSGGTRHA